MTESLKTLVVSGVSVEEAIENGLAQLNATADQVDVDVLDVGK